MSLPIILPTVGADNGTWGAELNAALALLNNADTFKVKAADQSIASSATLTDDTHLAGITLAPGTYIVSALFLASGAAASRVKIAWQFSGTFTGYRGGVGPAVGSTDVTGMAAPATTVGVNRASGAGGNSAVITSGTVYGLDGTNWSAIVEQGLLVVTATGVLKVQWSQHISGATATIMRAGSYIWARQVA